MQGGLRPLIDTSVEANQVGIEAFHRQRNFGGRHAHLQIALAGVGGVDCGAPANGVAQALGNQQRGLEGQEQQAPAQRDSDRSIRELLDAEEPPAETAKKLPVESARLRRRMLWLRTGAGEGQRLPGEDPAVV